MAQVQMQVYRGTSDYLDTISNVDGQFLYDEDTHQILVDNGTTREQYGGGNEKVYDTYAEAVADLANIADGQTVFVKEGTSSDKPTITYAEWQQLSDIEKEAFSGYVSNFPEEQLNASAITYGNTNVGAELTSINTHLTTRDIVYTPVSGWNPNVVESKVSANNLTLALTFNGIGIITQDTNRPIKIGTLAMKPYVLTPINCYNMATATVANDIAAWVDTNGDVYWEHYSSGTKTIDIIGSFLVH